MDETTKPKRRSRPQQRRPGASHSFTKEQVTLLKNIFDAALCGGDLTVLRRTKAFTDIYRKIGVMQKRIDETKALRDAAAKEKDHG